ncbi:MAG: class I SAM-dependent methyltransferase [Alphaproteobacteria bacterium]|nr:class I SAM-dependent methyltransferase [Alphaproteobacteria bacterium]
MDGIDGDITRNARVVKSVLHVGCGVKNPAKLHKQFQSSEWQEVRLDINPDVEPDIVASMTDMHAVDDAQFDAIWSSHNLEHLETTDVPTALKGFVRVLRPGGFLLTTLPDLQKVAELVAQDKLDEPAYVSRAGPIAPLDMIFGHRASIARGNKFMAQRTGFTAKTLQSALESEGFERVRVKREGFDLWAVAHKPPHG